MPFGLLSQNLDNNINIKYESGLDSLIYKNEKIKKNKDGVLGWRIQLTFKSTKREIVDTNNIEDVVSIMTGIKVQTIASKEKKVLSKMSDKINKTIIGLV